MPASRRDGREPGALRVLDAVYLSLTVSVPGALAQAPHGAIGQRGLGPREAPEEDEPHEEQCGVGDAARRRRRERRSAAQLREEDDVPDGR